MNLIFVAVQAMSSLHLLATIKKSFSSMAVQKFMVRTEVFWDVM